MKVIWLILVFIIVLGLVAFFFPKYAGSGGTCADCINTNCECFGYQKDFVSIGPWHSKCYGIPHNCVTNNPQGVEP